MPRLSYVKPFFGRMASEVPSFPLVNLRLFLRVALESGDGLQWLVSQLFCRLADRCEDFFLATKHSDKLAKSYVDSTGKWRRTDHKAQESVIVANKGALCELRSNSAFVHRELLSYCFAMRRAMWECKQLCVSYDGSRCGKRDTQKTALANPIVEKGIAVWAPDNAPRIASCSALCVSYADQNSASMRDDGLHYAELFL